MEKIEIGTWFYIIFLNIWHLFWPWVRVNIEIQIQYWFWKCGKIWSQISLCAMLCIKNLRVVFLNMSKTSLYFIKTDTECTELINQKDENKHFFACVVRVCLETPQLFTHPNLHTVEQSYLTCYHFKWGKPKTQTPSKLCQKIGYGKTSLHINQFLYCCPLISLWKYFG